MRHIAISKVIHAPPAFVFQTVADIMNFSEAVPEIKDVEFLSESRVGIGTKFRETRMMRGKEYKTVLEVTEYVNNDHVRMVADEGGTVWDSLFSVALRGESTQLNMRMDVRPYKLMSKIIAPLILGVVQRGVEENLDSIKVYCEEQHPEMQSLEA